MFCEVLFGCGEGIACVCLCLCWGFFGCLVWFTPSFWVNKKLSLSRDLRNFVIFWNLKIEVGTLLGQKIHFGCCPCRNIQHKPKKY